MEVGRGEDGSNHEEMAHSLHLKMYLIKSNHEILFAYPICRSLIFS